MKSRVQHAFRVGFDKIRGETWPRFLFCLALGDNDNPPTRICLAKAISESIYNTLWYNIIREGQVAGSTQQVTRSL